MGLLVHNADNGERVNLDLHTLQAFDAPAQTAGTAGAPRYYIVFQNAQGRTTYRWPFATAYTRNNILDDIDAAQTAGDTFIEVATT